MKEIVDKINNNNETNKTEERNIWLDKMFSLIKIAREKEWDLRLFLKSSGLKLRKTITNYSEIEKIINTSDNISQEKK